MLVEREEGREINIVVRENDQLVACHTHLDRELNLQPTYVP